jgi:hypothetical protein
MINLHSFFYSFFCRFAEKDPYSDILFGSGYGTEKALRYEWLLSLKERIPDEEVEERTNQYWEEWNKVVPHETRKQNYEDVRLKIVNSDS